MLGRFGWPRRDRATIGRFVGILRGMGMQRVVERGLGAVNRLWSKCAELRLRLAGVSVGRGCRFYGSPLVALFRGSNIRVGDRVVLVSKSSKTALGVNHRVILRTLAADAEISIGEDTGMSGGSICAARRVEIGSGCLIGANVTIVDTDFHAVDAIGRRHLSIPPPSEGDSVVIGDDVFIGTGSFILKGARVGKGAVVGAGSVVTGKVAEGTIVAGVPARMVRQVRHG